ncbi:hypothetical protein F5I97DRAFT_1870087 [Phlebopus sp. FC_14]|nr:hypothetical protein F5I97DRAFT_1870087 [Phlebopus sp. FC_14]
MSIVLAASLLALLRFKAVMVSNFHAYIACVVRTHVQISSKASTGLRLLPSAVRKSVLGRETRRGRPMKRCRGFVAPQPGCCSRNSYVVTQI